MREYGKLHRAMCFESSPMGRFTHRVSTAIKSPDMEVPVEPGAKTVKVLCPCCVFWRGVLVGGLLGLLVGVVM